MASRPADRWLTPTVVGPARGSHRLLPHTADVGLEAEGPDLPTVFAEAARAIGELTADVGAGVRVARRPVAVDGRDLEALAFAWLNELVAIVDLGDAVVGAEVDRVATGPDGRWVLRASLATVPGRDPRVRRRAAVKSATYHGLLVHRSPDGRWRLIAYLDV